VVIEKRFIKAWQPFFSGAMGVCWFSIALLFLCSSACAVETLERIAKSGSIKLGYEDSSPPFSYLGDRGQPIGYSIDVCMKIVEAVKRELKRADLATRFVLVPPSSSLLALVTGDVDIECGATTSTAYRRKQVSFTIPTFFATTKFMVHETSRIDIPNGLSGKTVVTTKGSRGEELFDEYQNRIRAKRVLAKDDAEALDMLESGRVDAFMSDDVRLHRLRMYSSEPRIFKIAPFPLNVEPLSIVLSKDDKTFKKLVDTEMARIITQGELTSIYKKWFQSPISPQQINLDLPMGSLLLNSLSVPTDWLPP